MTPTNIFITVFYNGYVEETPTEGILFRCHNNTLVKLNSNFKLAQVKQAIEKKISPDHSKMVATITYRYPTTLTHGHKNYGGFKINSDDDIELMIEHFKECRHLGIITPEIYADLVDSDSNYTQVSHSISSSSQHNIPFSQQIEIPYTKIIPPIYPQFSPSSSQFDIHYGHSIPHHQSAPSSSNTLIDLNTSQPINTPLFSLFVGVHNEDVGDFSEDEDEILQHEDVEEPIKANPNVGVAFRKSVPHFQNVTTDNLEPYDVEFGHSMDRNKNLVNEDPNELRLKMKFPTKVIAQQFIQTYHLNNSVAYKVSESSSRLWTVCCVHETCTWRCVVRLGAKSGRWAITQLTQPHTCKTLTISEDHRQLTSSFICTHILPLVRQDPTISVVVLIAHIKERFTYQSSYRKAWIAKQKAIELIYGNWELSYNEVTRWLCAFSRYIPDTFYDWQYKPFNENGQQVAEKGVFHRIFWSFGPCIKGFQFCKPVVSVDRTWLYGSYKGCLLMAIAQDGRNNTFPIAYAVVEGETAEAWFFFLSRLRHYVTPQEGLCLISDRHESIKSAVIQLNTNWKHVFCIRHIAQNFMRQFKNTTARKHVINMAYSMTETSAQYYKQKIWEEVGSEGVAWVEDITREQLLQCCDGGSRWGHMTTNLAECINNILKGVRNLPIRSLIEATYVRMNEVFVKRGTQAQTMLTSGTMYSEKLLENIAKNIKVSKTHIIAIHNRAQQLFRVQELARPSSGRPAATFVVDFIAKTCECGEFQALHYPCSHVIAACSKSNYDHMLFVNPPYKMENVFNTYIVEFPPLPTETSWPDFNVIELQHDPTKQRDKKGLPQFTRIRTHMNQR